MSDAITLLGKAYRDHNLEPPTAFDETQEFPYNIAQQLINEVVMDLNKLGNFWFSETATALAYSDGVYQYDLTALGVNPRRIAYIRRDSTTTPGELVQLPYRSFQRTYRSAPVATGTPFNYAIFRDQLEFDYSPDADYTINVYHYKDMPAITATTDSQDGGEVLIPTEYEDLLSVGCYQYLGAKIGRWPYENALSVLLAKAQPFMVVARNDSGMAQQFPAAF